MRTLPRALTAVAVTGLLLGGLSAPTATAAPVSVQHAALPASVTAVTGVAATAKKKAPSIAWTTIKRKTLAPVKGKGYEELRVPYLKNASAKATKAFNKEVSRQFAALRHDLKQSRASYSCPDPVEIYASKIGGSVYKGRYASAAVTVYAYDGCGGAHGWSTSADVTVDLKTGKHKSLSSFVKTSKKKATSVLTASLLKKGATPGFGGTSVLKPSAWYLGTKGVTYVYDPYVMGAYGDGYYTATLAWRVASKR